MNDKPSDNGNDVKEPDVNPDEKKSPDNNNPIPQWRFNEVNTERNELRKKIETMEAAQEDAKKKKMEKDGEYKQLLDDEIELRKKYENDSKQWEEYRENRRNSLMDKLSDDDKLIAKKISDLDGLEAFVDRIAKKGPAPTDGRAPGANAGQYGGYKSRAEFAMNEPQKYEEWKTKQAALQTRAGVVRLPGQEPYIR